MYIRTTEGCRKRMCFRTLYHFLYTLERTHNALGMLHTCKD
ncbi:unnamed protein product [Staurois parvus]|uniref:Uncharacterized protein n=1 Tax=Staurois parvus TaxID=386267 RepID=A0ABN9CC91_9NEOB|nr:unnamed protein product [Staurois parvus]